jgi:hypothetical protein
MLTPWAPAPADPLRLTILAALADRALALREHGPCADCSDKEPCPDYTADADLAAQFENAYLQVAAGSAAWCDLAVKLISEMN